MMLLFSFQIAFVQFVHTIMFFTRKFRNFLVTYKSSSFMWPWYLFMLTINTLVYQNLDSRLMEFTVSVVKYTPDVWHLFKQTCVNNQLKHRLPKAHRIHWISIAVFERRLGIRLTLLTTSPCQSIVWFV